MSGTPFKPPESFVRAADDHVAFIHRQILPHHQVDQVFLYSAIHNIEYKDYEPPAYIFEGRERPVSIPRPEPEPEPNNGTNQNDAEAESAVPSTPEQATPVTGRKRRSNEVASEDSPATSTPSSSSSRSSSRSSMRQTKKNGAKNTKKTKK